MTDIIAHTPRFSTPVIVHDSPFRARSGTMLAPEGASLADIVAMAGITSARIMPHVHVYVDDMEIPQDRWHRVRPKEGVSVYVQVRLHGGDGGDGEKNPLRVILMLAVVVLAAYFAGPGALFGGKGAMFNLGSKFLNFAANMAVSAGIATAGYFLVNAIAPPPRLPGAQYGWGQQDGNPYATLTGISNRFAPYSPVPRVFGARRMFPLLAARPYTENLNGKQFLRILLLVGYGRLRLSDIRIGDTPISAFAGASVETREGLSTDAPVTLFTRIVKEDGLTIRLQRSTDTASAGAPPEGWNPGFDWWSTYDFEAPDVPLSAPARVDPTSYTFSPAGDWTTRTTRTNTNEISVDFSAPRGLFRANAQGRRYEHQVNVLVQYRATGTSGAWLTPTWLDASSSYGTQNPGTIEFKALSPDPLVRSGRFSTGSSGQWDVRVKHGGPSLGSDPTYVDDIYWSALRSISTDTPIRLPGMALIGLKLEATDQLNGAPDTINCLAESYLPTWNGTAWTDSEPVISRNPAWAYAHVMRWRGQSRMIPDSRIDATRIAAWATACAETAPNASEPRWTYDNVIEGGSVYQALRDIAGHGRADFTVVDGKYSVVRDVEQTVPVQIITPRNSWGYEGRKAFLDIPHAFRCGFSNKDQNYEPDEVIVYRDGYAKEAGGGNVAATKFEVLQFPGATSSTQAWREGRYHLATLLLRPEEHSVQMDPEHLIAIKGDLVRLTYDTISVGLGSGRIAGRTVDDGDVTHFDIDQPVTMEAGKSYTLRVRKRDGTSALYPVETAAGFAETLELTTPVAEASAPMAGDLYAFGEAGLETAPMIVKTVESGPDLTARVVLIDAQAGVWTADTGTIPAFQTNITGRRPMQDAPVVPSFKLTSSEAALLRLADGTLQERILVRIQPSQGDQVAVTRYEVQFRQAGGGDWTPTPPVPPDAPVLAITGVRALDLYDVRVRAWGVGGTPSNWAVATDHTVIGKTTRPANVSGLAVSRRIDGVVLTFTAVADIDLWAYEVRRGGTEWADATHIGYFTATTIGLQETLSGDTIYRVTAIDVIGLESETAASVTASGTLPTFAGTASAVPWSGVSGSGRPADNATVGAVIGGNLVTASSSVPTQAQIITSEGTAAAISGQTAWATESTPVAAVLAPQPNLFPFPSPIWGGNYGGSTPAPSSYGWGGYDNAIGAQYYSPVGGPIYFRAKDGGGPTQESYFFDVPGIIAGVQYTASLNGYVSGGTFTPYIEYLNSDRSAILAALYLTYDGAFGRWRVTSTAPAGAAWVRVVALANFGGVGYQDVVFNRIKVEQGAVMTPLSSPLELAPRQAGADVTVSNTAAAISGQGWGATASEAAASNAQVPTGINAAPNSEFLAGTSYPPLGWTGGGPGNTGGSFAGVLITGGPRRAVRARVTGSLAAAGYFDAAYGTYGDPASLRRYWLPVAPGDKIAASALVAVDDGLSHATVAIYWKNAAGSYIGENHSTVITGATNGDTGNPADYTLGVVAAVAPANAAFASLFVRGTIRTGGASTGTTWFMSPLLVRMQPDAALTAAAVPPYHPTPIDRLADVTVSNTAAAITGQGGLATRNDVDSAHIVSEAVTKALFHEPSAQDFAAPSPDITTARTFATISGVATASGDNVMLLASFFLNTIGSTGQITIEVRRGGSAIKTITPAGYFDAFTTVTLYYNAAIVDVDQPSAGTHEYTLTARAASNSGTIQVKDVTFIATRFRR